eukprot:251271-Rhodomonas_salina.1
MNSANKHARGRPRNGCFIVLKRRCTVSRGSAWQVVRVAGRSYNFATRVRFPMQYRKRRGTTPGRPIAY